MNNIFSTRPHPTYPFIIACSDGRLLFDAEKFNDMFKHYPLLKQRKSKEISFYNHNHGYLGFNVCIEPKVYKKFLAHRFIIQAFLGLSPEDKPYTNHINGNKKDNRIENLEWVSMNENNTHSYKEIVSKGNRGFLYEEKKVYQYDLNKVLIKEYESLSQLKKLGFSIGRISQICNNKTKKKTYRNCYFSYEKLGGIK